MALPESPNLLTRNRALTKSNPRKPSLVQSYERQSRVCPARQISTKRHLVSSFECGSHFPEHRPSVSFRRCVLRPSRGGFGDSLYLYVVAYRISANMDGMFAAQREAKIPLFVFLQLNGPV